MKKILIIDDDPDMCMLLTRFLTKNGYETESANSGSKGLARFKDAHFDIVLCDYRLGDKDGKDVLTEIKAHAPHTIVVIITGYSDIKTAVDVIKLGACDYITKPLIPDEVLNVLRNALANPVSPSISSEPVTSKGTVNTTNSLSSKPKGNPNKLPLATPIS